MFNIFKKGSKNESFQYEKLIIQNPQKYSQEVVEVSSKLNHQEKHFLNIVCDLLQENISRFDQCIKSIKSMEVTPTNTVDIEIKDNSIKTNFELTVLFWVLVTHYFKTISVRDQVGHVLWYIFQQSFKKHEQVFAKSYYKSFEKAFADRQGLYIDFLNSMSKDKSTVKGNSEIIYGLIVEHPLINQQEESVMYSLDYFNRVFRMSAFYKEFWNILSEFDEKLKMTRV